MAIKFKDSNDMDFDLFGEDSADTYQRGFDYGVKLTFKRIINHIKKERKIMENSKAETNQAIVQYQDLLISFLEELKNKRR